MSTNFTAREALIPVVGGTEGGAVARVAADGELAAPHPAHLDRSLVELLENGLYQAGQQAKAAIRLLALPGRGWLARSSEALHVVNPGDIVGLSAENASSAELGLALALVLFQSQAEPRAVIASGALDLGGATRDIRVLPIHHLAGKLRLVARHFSQPGSAPAPKNFIVPTHDPDGASVVDRYQPEIQALSALSIEVRCVWTLADAAQIVGARRRAQSRTERGLRRMLAAVAGIIVVAVAARYWFNAPIPLSFTPVASAEGSVIATPARSVPRTSPMELLRPCRAGDDLPAFSVGEYIAVRLRTGSLHGLGTWLGGYQHVLVSVSGSGVKVLPPPSTVPVAPGADVGYLLEVREPQEETLLVWLAKRGSPFDPAGLEAHLRRQLQPLQPGERISAARNLLKSAAPGVLLYSFRSVSPEACR